MGIFKSAASLTRQLPAGELPARVIEAYGEGLAAVERTVLRALASRLADVVPQPAPTQPERDTRERDLDAREVMAALLARALQTDTEAGQRDYYVNLLTQLLPDEARIIAALAAGPPAPLVHVLRRSNGEPVLQNASIIGRTAAVTIPSLTASYVTRLTGLGLVETGPEDPDQQQNYELLMAERDVRAALKEGEFGKLPAKVQRQTLRLSLRGRELWEAARPEGRS